MEPQKSLFNSSQSCNLTPMMQQYLSIKAEHQDCLLFYRLGDFYELFFDDATTAAPILDVVLTKRGKSEDDHIPMCGVPYHSCNPYISKLLKAGFKIAICEQLESPAEAKKRGAKSVVRREVVRIITAGTILEDHLLESNQDQNLVGIHLLDDELNISSVDITTGRLILQKSSAQSLGNDLVRLKPREILLADKTFNHPIIRKSLDPYKSMLSLRADSLFSSARAAEKIKQFYGILSLDSLGSLDAGEIIVLGSLLEYISYTQKGIKPRLEKPRKLNTSHYLEIDCATRRNLEIMESISGDRKKSVIHVIDKTITPMGSRLFAHHIAFPLANPAAINKRLDVVEFFIRNEAIITSIRELLKSMPDLERLVGKVFAERAHFQDLIMIREGLKCALSIADNLRIHSEALPDILKIALNQIGDFSDVLEVLSKALAANIMDVQNQKYIKPGFSPKLDGLYVLKTDASSAIQKLLDKYKNLTGINNLKINFNNMLGYFIEVTASQITKINTESFTLRQSMVSSSRYTTKELQDLEREIAECDQNIAAEESEIFTNLCAKVKRISEQIISCAHSIANIDVGSSNAFFARKHKCVRPIVDDSYEFIVEAGRHPLVESYAGSAFIPNSCTMDASHNLWLITGPNMAGKSTFLRQNAVIIIMAQMGCYVPAKSARIGVVDKLFSRIGASDDISSGHSTFMVEMIETANILNNSTARSFLILDEVGRGTSTKDGLSIAWAILENINNKIKARTLFATHYHELTDLEGVLPNLKCYTMRVKEWDNKVVFIHEVISGKADKSYGIHVAQLAGLPAEVIGRAGELLEVMQNNQASNLNVEVVNDNNTGLADEIRSINFDILTPKAALDLLYSLRGKL
ncbi:MAG: mismatch repair protein MutS [Candidatus Midichloriaceae bacterium]|jgi:DNA mismatch repair protein MutS|nr:mismatch repair protein MutS [Candidatus Midichloriaceae bacterium]